MNAITRGGYQDVPMSRRRTQLLAEYAERLATMLENAPDDKDLAEWVQSKIDRAASSIQSAYHYLDQEDDLEKARAKLYDYRRPSKRINKKTGRREWDYFYTKRHGGRVSSGAFEQGAAFRLTFKGRKGHFHIDHVEGDMIHITHDAHPDKKLKPIHRDELRALLKRQNRREETKHLARKKRAVDKLKRNPTRKRSSLGLALHRLRQAAEKAGVALPEEYQRKPKKPRVKRPKTAIQGQGNFEGFNSAQRTGLNKIVSDLEELQRGKSYSKSRDIGPVSVTTRIEEYISSSFLLDQGLSEEEQKSLRGLVSYSPVSNKVFDQIKERVAEIDLDPETMRSQLETFVSSVVTDTLKILSSEADDRQSKGARLALKRFETPTTKQEQAQHFFDVLGITGFKGRRLSVDGDTARVDIKGKDNKIGFVEFTEQGVNFDSMPELKEDQKEAFNEARENVGRPETETPREDRFDTMPEVESTGTARDQLTTTAQEIITEADQDHDERHDEHQSIEQFELGEHTHTKTGVKLFTAKQKGRTDRDEYRRRVEIAKKHGGRYERRYVKGFLFKTAEDARNFALEVEGGQVEESAETVTPHEDHPQADNFETMVEVESAEDRTRGDLQSKQQALDLVRRSEQEDELKGRQRAKGAGATDKALMRAVRELLKRPDPTQDLDERDRQRLRDSLFSLEEAQRPNKYRNAQRSKEARQRARATIEEILNQQVKMLSEALDPRPIPQTPAQEPTPSSVQPANVHGRATKKTVDQALSSEPTGISLDDTRFAPTSKGDLREMLSQEQRLKRAKDDLRSVGAPNIIGQSNPLQDIMYALDRYLDGPYVELGQKRIREIERQFKISLRDARGEDLEQTKDEIARFWREWGGEYKRLQSEFARGRTQGEALRNIRSFIPERALTPEINQVLDQMGRELDQRPVTDNDITQWINTRDTNQATKDRSPTPPREQAPEPDPSPARQALTETAEEIISEPQTEPSEQASFDTDAIQDAIDNGHELTPVITLQKQFIEKRDAGLLTPALLQESLRIYETMIEGVVEAKIKKKKKGVLLSYIASNINAMTAYHLKSEKKQNAIEEMMSSFLRNVTNTPLMRERRNNVTYNIFDLQDRETDIERIKRLVSEYTEEDAIEDNKRLKAEIEQAKQRQAEKERLLSNPQTAQDFIELKRLRRNKGEDLSAEQHARHNDLVARSRRGKREDEKTKQAPQKTITGGFESFETKHSKTGADLYAVRPAESVGRDEYLRLKAEAKKQGGYYSSYRTVRGFVFPTPEAREQFIQANQQPEAEPQEPVDKQRAKRDALRERLEGYRDSANEALNADRRTNTARRARFARYATEDAFRRIEYVNRGQRILNAIDEGRAYHLQNISNATDLDMLQSIVNRAKSDDLSSRGLPWSEYEKEQDRLKNTPIEQSALEGRDLYPDKLMLHPSDLKSLKKYLTRSDGTARRGARTALAELNAMLSEPKEKRHVVSMDTLMRVLAHVPPEADKSFGVLGRVVELKRDHDRMKRLGIENEIDLKAVLREYEDIVYQRSAEDEKAHREAEEAKAERDRLIRRGEFARMNIPSYFPTPTSVIDRMIEIAGIEEGETVLEPSAGAGHILEKLADTQASVKAIETNYTLRNYLEDQGHEVVGNDALEHSDTYDHVIMNPPFEKQADIEHVTHAFENNLVDGGRLVAVMSASAMTRDNKKARDFQDLVNKYGHYERLPEGTFKDSDRQTGVNTILVVLDLPDSGLKKSFYETLHLTNYRSDLYRTIERLAS